MSLLLRGGAAAGLGGGGDLTGICQDGSFGAEGDGGNCRLGGGDTSGVRDTLLGWGVGPFPPFPFPDPQTRACRGASAVSGSADIGMDSLWLSQ